MADDECSCRNGQRQVTDVWARQEAGIAPAADLAALEREATRIAQARLAHHEHRQDPNWPLPTEAEQAVADQWAKYRAALNTVFPCPTCRPKQFARWRNGCYRPNHVPKRCRLCKDDK
mgnify:CR=1 FL=1